MTECYVPDWEMPANVRALQTTRSGGISRAPWAGFNLGDHVGDDPAAVAANRAALCSHLPGEPRWLTQVHGTVAVDAEKWPKMAYFGDPIWLLPVRGAGPPPRGDFRALWCPKPGGRYLTPP